MSEDTVELASLPANAAVKRTRGSATGVGDRAIFGVFGLAAWIVLLVVIALVRHARRCGVAGGKDGRPASAAQRDVGSQRRQIRRAVVRLRHGRHVDHRAGCSPGRSGIARGALPLRARAAPSGRRRSACSSSCSRRCRAWSTALWGCSCSRPSCAPSSSRAWRRRSVFLPLFQGPFYGVGMLTGGVLLSIMILPTVAAIARDVFGAVPIEQREAMLALGATKWEMLTKAVIPYARSGVIGALVLALGRALGEAMAVVMVIGNKPAIAASLFAPGYTMASVLANEFTEATGQQYVADADRASVCCSSCLSMVVNVIARAARVERQRRSCNGRAHDVARAPQGVERVHDRRGGLPPASPPVCLRHHRPLRHRQRRRRAESSTFFTQIADADRRAGRRHRERDRRIVRNHRARVHRGRADRRAGRHLPRALRSRQVARSRCASSATC